MMIVKALIRYLPYDYEARSTNPQVHGLAFAVHSPGYSRDGL